MITPFCNIESIEWNAVLDGAFLSISRDNAVTVDINTYDFRANYKFFVGFWKVSLSVQIVDCEMTFGQPVFNNVKCILPSTDSSKKPQK